MIETVRGEVVARFPVRVSERHGVVGHNEEFITLHDGPLDDTDAADHEVRFPAGRMKSPVGVDRKFLRVRPRRVVVLLV